MLQRLFRYAKLLTLYGLFSADLLEAQPISINGDKLRFSSVDGKKLQYLDGNVSFEQNGNRVRCDQAVFDMDANFLTGSGNVLVTSSEGMTVNGDLLEYDGKNQVARVLRNVVLRDGDMTLRAPSVQYNTQTRTGYYLEGGHILNGDIDLRSRTGSYNAVNKTLYFRRNVELKHPEYTMRGDTLQYNTQTRTAGFFGPTAISSEDNTIYCQRGWYNTATGLSRFWSGARIVSKENTLSADTLSFDRNAGIGKARGNILLHDSVQDFSILGEFGWYDRNDKRSRIYGNPVSHRSDPGNDSLFLKADTFVYVQDTLAGKRVLTMFHQAALLQGDFSGRCDSIVYLVEDSTFRLFGQPVLWSGNNRLHADTMRVLLANKRLYKMELRRNAFVSTMEDSAHFSQMSGLNMDQWFGTDNKLRTARIIGSGRSLYYIRENDSLLGGANIIKCSDMQLAFDSGRVESVRFYGAPEGNVYPMDQIPEGADKLSGFVWDPERMPLRPMFDFIRPEPVRIESPAPAVGKPIPPVRRRKR